MKKSDVDTREGNYDLLRIICTIAVIVIHVSGTYKTAITDASTFGSLYSEHIMIIVAYNTISRFAVPCFMMLSGAFLIANSNNAKYKIFYRKTFKSIGIPTIVFSALYISYNIVSAIIKILVRGYEVTILFTPLSEAVKGVPFYHMWYLYTLIGVYILIPFIIKLKDDLGEEVFEKMSMIMLVLCTISGWTSTFLIHWSCSKVVCYIGYILIGYQIRKRTLNKKNNVIGVSAISMGVILEIILSLIQYNHSCNGIAEADEVYSVVGNFNPIVVVASVLIFFGFSKMQIDTKMFSKLSSKTFLIYLFHAGVWRMLTKIVKALEGNILDCRVIIPISIIIVFLVSYALSFIYEWIYNKISNNLSTRISMRSVD